MSVSRTTTTANLRSRSPAGRVNSAKLSSRSNVSIKSGSQASEVGDLLSIAPAVKGKRNKAPVPTGNKGKNTLQNSGNKRSTRPNMSQSVNVTKTKSCPEKKTVERPAWSVKPAVEDDTPRSNISLASTFNLPSKPSLNDFLDFPEDDQNIHFSALPSHRNDKARNTKDIKKQSLLEYLSADTDRSELNITSTNEKCITNHQVTMSNEKPEEKVNPSYLCGSNNNRNIAIINGFSDDDGDNFQITKNFTDYDNIHRFNNFNNIIYTGGTSSINNVVSTSSTSSKNKVSTKKCRSNIDDGDVNNVTNTKQQTNTCKGNAREYRTSLQKQITFLEQREAAAKCIQLWWRKMNIRRTAGAAAMRRMMQDKQKQMEGKLSMQRQKEFDKQVQEYDQMKRREEKARSARQSVLNEMQSKRGNNIKSNKEKTKKQTKSSQSNEKGSSSKTKPLGQTSKQKPALNSGGGTILNGGVAAVQLNDEKPTVINSPRPGTSSSVGRKIEEIFEASTKDGQSTAIESVCNTNDDNLTYVLGDEKVSRTTYDDLLNTIKELEGVPLHTTSNVAELWGGVSDAKKKETSLSVDYLQKLQVPNALPTPGSYLSADKLQNILTFLDEVEKVEEDVRSEVLRQSKEANISEVGTLLDQTSLHGGQDSMMESASQVATDIGNAILAKKQEIDEKKKSLEMMRKAMGQQKEFTTMQMVEMDKEHKQQLQLQRDEYEGNIQRHLAFIDQLIDDKKALTERCEVLVTKLKDVDQKYSTKIKQLCENHTLELKKQKEIGEAAEKLRREKWIKEKTQEIKEITVKGLEPDIQKLIGKHKAEIKKIKAMKQGEVLDADERVGRRYIQQMEDVRAQLGKEKEVAVRKERDGARQRFESQMREEESAFQQQRRRLYQEIEEEKERCAEQMQKYKKECDEKQSAMEESFKQTATYSQGDHEKQLKEIDKNHEAEMRSYKEQVDIEKQQWIENYMKKQETHLLTKERQLKEGVRDTRDKEIEMVISRLEKEATTNREEAEKTAENRIKRIRDKYEKEIKELEHSEKSLQEKYNTIKERMAESEGEQLQLKSECKQKEQELVDMRKITDRLQEERGKVTDVIRQEFADRLVVLEEESKRLRTELSEEKARHKFDVDKLTASKEEEMDELHKRVKKAISNKDENSKLLRDKMLAAEKRAEHLEQLLTDQRKKLLGD